MKLAGSKNQGAWFRFNKWLRKGNNGGPQNQDAMDALKAALLASDYSDAYYNALAGIAADAGFAAFPASTEQLVITWLNHGIPLQVWMGKLSWTEYDKTTEGDETFYTPRGQHDAHFFGKDVRRICRHFKASWIELIDLGNFDRSDNPGGLPDADGEQ